MANEIVLSHEFVEFIPNELKERTIYISYTYCTALHKCCCGCGREVVTPISPTAWKLIFDGKTISLYPSIGSWNLPCQSHYFITNNRVIWASKWTQKRIAKGRTREARIKEQYYSGLSHSATTAETPSAPQFECLKSKVDSLNPASAAKRKKRNR